MKKYLLLFLLITSCVLYKGQNKIEKIDSATGGRLTIEADDSIIALIKEDQLCKKITKSSTESKTNTSKNEVTDSDTSRSPKTQTASSGAKRGSTGSSTKNICGSRKDIPGFMIKVGEAKSEGDINTMISNFRSKFPGLRVEKTYLRPDWRLLAGDYFKKESAQSDLKRIKQSYPTAMVINWRIYCNRAK